jgi:outer membrane biosynthesis protein TonB
MNLRRVLAIGLAAGSLATAVGSTALVASASTTPTGKTNVHHRHNCVTPEPGTAPGKKCVQKPKPKHTPKATHTSTPTPKPHPKHPVHPKHPTHP